MLEQQNATTLVDALRNTPGITMSIGEGASGTVDWDSKHGHWLVKLIDDEATATQTLHLSATAQQWDVLMSEKRDARGNIEWRLTNKDFKPVTGADGRPYRLPDRTPELVIACAF